MKVKGLEAVFDALFKAEMAAYLKKLLRHEKENVEGDADTTFILCPQPGRPVPSAPDRSGPFAYVFRDDERDMPCICMDESRVAAMIGGAPVPVETKIGLLEKLAEDNDSEYFRKIAGQASHTLRALDDNSDDVLYAAIGEADLCSDAWVLSERPFHWWKSVHAQVRKIAEEYSCAPELISASVTKWKAGSDQDFRKTCWCSVAYPRISSPEIWYLAGEDEDDIEHDANFFGFPSLNLPVPFSAGDVLSIDCRPYAPLRHIVLLRKMDNCDCCSLVGLYQTDEGEDRWDIGAVKHNFVFPVGCDARSLLSCMYRLARFDGILPEGEGLLSEVSKYIGADEERGQKLDDFIWRQERDASLPGISGSVILAYIRDQTRQEEIRATQ